MTAPRVVRNRRRLGPLAFLRAYPGLRRARATGDPQIVFQVMRPFHTRSFERTFARVLEDPAGRRLLEQERSLLPVLTDLPSLEALPEGSLGREYARFVDREKLSGAGFADASEASLAASDYADPRAYVLAQRLRDMHDLVHVVSGYGRDLLGEMAVLSFSSAKAGRGGDYRLTLLLRLVAWKFARAGRPDARGVLRDAARRGERAAFLPAVEWESLLPLPLREARARLHVSEPPAYAPIRPELYASSR